MADTSASPKATDAAGRAIHGVWVAAVALIALVGIVAIAVLTLPASQKGQNIIAISSASFGVIGAIVGAYFGVSSANRAAEIVRASRDDARARGLNPGSRTAGPSGPATPPGPPSALS